MAAIAPPLVDAPAQPAAAAPAVQPVPHNSSLYVGDLERDVTEAQLYDLFAQVGPVASIRVCRDAVTRRSLGYAYVNFNNALDPAAAERALDALNYSVLNGKPIRIMWSHRDPSFRRSGVGNIFIKNLDKSIDNKALHDTFMQFGSILSCKVATDGQGQSKGYGFVHFETEEAANLAIEKVNNMQLNDKVVYVGHFLKRGERPSGKDANFTNVYVKNLSEDVDDKEFGELMKEFGDVSSAVVMKDSSSGKSRGFGFVNFGDADAANRAVEALNSREYKGKKLFVGRAQKKAERESMLRQKYEEQRQERVAKYQGMNLYIKNLHDDVTDADLRSAFDPYGAISSAKVMVDDKKKSKGFGFVCYSSHEEATRAVTEMNGKMLRGKPLYVALAQRKEVRRAQLQQQLNQNRMAFPPAAAGRAPGPMPGMFPGPGGAPPMFYPGPGAPMPGGRGPLPGMYPQMMGPGAGGRMPPPPGAGGRGGPRGPPGMPPGAAPLGAPMAPPAPGPRGAGRGGRGAPRPEHDRSAGAPPPGGRGGRGGRARSAGRGPPPPPATPAGQPAPPAPPAPAAQPAPPPVQAPPPAPAPPEPLGLAAQLANAAPEQQKQMLGERLFPLVQQAQPDLAGKITGMLLEMDNMEVLLLLDNPDSLAEKVDEAIAVLKQHNAIPAGVQIKSEAK